MRKLLEDAQGNISSKRYGLIKSINHLILMSWVALIVLLYKEQYTYVIDILWGTAALCGAFGGVVASEKFGKNEKVSDSN